MKLRSKFIIVIVLITGVVSGIAMFFITDYVERTALDQAKQLTAQHVRSKAAEHLAPSDFGDSDFRKNEETFSSFMNIIRTSEIIKIKAFNARFDIVYSTNKADIGKKTDSVNYRNSLEKKAVVAVIKPPEMEAANIDMLGYRQVMEVYVPVEYNGQVAGVIEAYFRMDEINRSIAQLSRSVIGIIIGFAAVIIITMHALLSRFVVRPLLRITAGIDAIAAGRPGAELLDLRAGDEIGSLAARLKKMLLRDTDTAGKKMF